MKIIDQRDWDRLGWKARQEFLRYQGSELARVERLLEKVLARVIALEVANVPGRDARISEIQGQISRDRAAELLATLPVEPEGRARLRAAWLEARGHDPRRQRSEVAA